MDGVSFGYLQNVNVVEKAVFFTLGGVSERCTRAGGLQYNTALRYYETVTDSTRGQNSGAECMIITVSEDGGVSILPE